MVKSMELVFSNSKMEISTWDNGKMIFTLEKEYLFIKTERDIKDK